MLRGRELYAVCIFRYGYAYEALKANKASERTCTFSPGVRESCGFQSQESKLTHLLMSTTVVPELDLLRRAHVDGRRTS